MGMETRRRLLEYPMVYAPTSSSELPATHKMPVQDAVSRTVQVLQVQFELHGHVQLHLLRIESVYLE